MCKNIINKEAYLHYQKNAIECCDDDIDIDTINNKINNISEAIDKIDNEIIEDTTVVNKDIFIEFINSISDDNNDINLIDVYHFMKNCLHKNIEELCKYDLAFNVNEK